MLNITQNHLDRTDLVVLAGYDGLVEWSSLLATLDDRVRQLVINWPRQVVDALEERIDLEGFG